MASRHLLAVILLLPLALSHGIHHNDDGVDVSKLPWAHRHLRQEHHIFNYDAGAFFSLHDFDNDGLLSRTEILRTYGLPLQGVPLSTEERIWVTLANDIDVNRDGMISREEWMAWSRNGGELPDFGVGIGHHGDSEYEYEIHHFEQFHSEEDGDDKFIHKEDIEHFKKHDEEEKAEALEAQRQKQKVLIENIPLKFRVGKF